jgi:hypothetical protein
MERDVTQLSAHGFDVEVPRGWDGAVYRRGGDAIGKIATAVAKDGVALDGRAGRALHYPPILHLATFPLPPDRGDFGGGALDGMRARDLFVCLLEFETGSAGAPLFGADGVPWPLRPDDFSPSAMRVPIDNQAGCQRFFRVGARALTLYAVIGSHSLRRVLVPRINEALSGVRL